MANFDPNLPLSISIPLPTVTSLPRGENAIPGTTMTEVMRARCSYSDLRSIEEASDIVGCTNISEFIRWVATSAARQVIRENEKNVLRRKSSP